MPDATAPESPFQAGLRFDAVDLVGRTGSHRHVERTVLAPAPTKDETAGSGAMQAPQGEEIAVEAELESVVEGIYVHGTVTSRLTGECSRCLDPVEQDVSARIDELFMYPAKVKADEVEDTVLLDGDDIDLGPVVRDVLAGEAEDRPLCRPDCPGLCSQCGFRMEDDPDHHHVVYDDRFAALQSLLDDADADDGDGGDGGDRDGGDHDEGPDDENRRETSADDGDGR